MFVASEKDEHGASRGIGERMEDGGGACGVCHEAKSNKCLLICQADFGPARHDRSSPIPTRGFALATCRASDGSPEYGERTESQGGRDSACAPWTHGQARLWIRTGGRALTGS